MSPRNGKPPWEKVIIVASLTLLAASLLSNFKKPEKNLAHPVTYEGGISDPFFQREMGVLMGPAILPGNRITVLQNGDEIFPAMLDAIRHARRSITFETYIYWSGKIGAQFADALESRARAGVKVHVILDWAGSGKMDSDTLKAMIKAGVQVQRYHPLHWYTLARLNNRTHRKLLVVDGNVGFTGGVGIADNWAGHAQDPDHWRDVHFKVEGPAVADLQAAFMDNWIKTTGRVLHGDAYFPQLASVGDKHVHLFVGSPAGGSASMHLMYLLAITAAQRSIDIEAAYFVPDDLMTQALIAARHRGVRVRVLLPGKHMDSQTVKLASKRSWGPLLANGVEIYQYNPTMFHCKMLILDGEMVSVGSTNLDLRSFELNDEASLNVYDVAFSDQMTRSFEQDLTKSSPYSYAMWKRRPWTQKLAELILIPIASQL